MLKMFYAFVLELHNDSVSHVAGEFIMRQIIYASRRHSDFKPLKIFEMLNKARARNAELGLCGMLVYCNGQFLQLLEGFKAPVSALEEKIFADERHSDIKVISDAKISALSFTKWDMGYLNLEDNTKMLSRPFLEMTPGEAWQCLLSLRDQLGEAE